MGHRSYTKSKSDWVLMKFCTDIYRATKIQNLKPFLVRKLFPGV